MKGSDDTLVRRKVLLITRNLPPLLGGMERFNERVVDQLSKGFEVAVCGPTGCERFLPANMRVASVGIRPLPVFFVRMLIASVRMARAFRPDVVIAGSGLTAPMALIAARILRVRVLVFLYGLDLVASNRLYQWLWMPAIRACDGFIAISRHTRDLALATGIDSSRITIVHPGVDPPPDHRVDPVAFRKEHNVGERPILLSVGRLTRRKGIVEFINNSLPRIVLSEPNVVLLVIGGDPADALAGNRGGVTAEAREVARSHGLERNVLFLGRVSGATLQAAYSASRVHVFPIRDIPGDVEGFGLVALDAAILGIPTVAFSVGGVADAVEQNVSGILVTPGDYIQMADAVVLLLAESTHGWDECRRSACVEFARKFDWRHVGGRLREAVGHLAAF